MLQHVRLASIAAMLVATGAVPALAQTIADSTSRPSVENGGLIPAGLIVWLLGIAAALSAGLLTFVDRKMRSGKVAI